MQRSEDGCPIDGEGLSAEDSCRKIPGTNGVKQRIGQTEKTCKNIKERNRYCSKVKLILLMPCFALQSRNTLLKEQPVGDNIEKMPVRLRTV